MPSNKRQKYFLKFFTSSEISNVSFLALSTWDKIFFEARSEYKEALEQIIYKKMNSIEWKTVFQTLSVVM